LLALTNFLSAQSQAPQAFITVPNALLPPAVTYRFGVQVTHWLGVQSTLNSNSISKSFTPVLPLYFTGPRFQTTSTYIPLAVQASTVTSFTDSCFNASLVASFLVNLAWKQVFLSLLALNFSVCHYHSPP
jgi:hypothetical protein